MIYKIRKKIILCTFTLLMLGLAVFAGRFEKTDNVIPSVSVVSTNDLCIEPWLDEETGVIYYFIPSHLGSDDLSLSFDGGEKISIDGKNYTAGDTLSGVDYNKKLSLVDYDKTSYNVEFLKSNNISTVYVSTATGSMNSVILDKSHKELAKVTIIDKDGKVDVDTNDSRIKGRGNSTWQNKKKPFSLIFDESREILGMNASSEWALLANALDYSGIRNALVYDTARSIGLDNAPEYEFVDLYLNGVYNGLYMICQPVDSFIEEQTVNDEGTFLFTAELPDRAKNANYLLYAENGKSYVDVDFPKKLNSDDKKYAQEIVNKLDTEIAKCDDSIDDVIDIDSWVKKYLLDEVFENYDSGLASSYFYVNSKSTDSKVYAGPIWDYDMSIGNLHCFVGTTRNPEILFANQEYRTKNQRLLWYSELYKNPLFYNTMVDYFEKDLTPQMESLIQSDIKEFENRLKDSKFSDDVRWGKDSSEEYDYIIDYLTKRMDFLKSVWVDNEKYVEVTYYTPGKDSNYMRVFVPQGSTIASDPALLDLFAQSDKWYIDGTNETYDFETPVNEPVLLVNATSNNNSTLTSILNNASSEVKIAVIIFSLVFLGVLLMILQLSMNLKRGMSWEM